LLSSAFSPLAAKELLKSFPPQGLRSSQIAEVQQLVLGIFESCQQAILSDDKSAGSQKLKTFTKIARLIESTFERPPNNHEDIVSLLRSFVGEVLPLLRRGRGGVAEKEIVDSLLLHIGLSSYLPIMYQRRIATGSTEELRVNGILGANGPRHLGVIARGAIPEVGRYVRVVRPKDLQTPFKNRHDDPASQFLEVELEKPVDELLLFPDVRGSHRSAVLMSGTGRHARAIASRVSEVYAVDLSKVYIDQSEQRARQLAINNIHHFNDDLFHFLRAQTDGSLDSVAILGNSLIYLDPTECRRVLEESRRALSRGGVFLTDFVDLDCYQKVLKDLPIMHLTDRSYERLVERSLVSHKSETHLELLNLGIYIKDCTIETMHEKGSLYLPLIVNFLELLRESGFTDVDYVRFSSEFPTGSMMRDRIAVRASVK
jgi:SAM-dependent methyltransferase